MDNKEIISVILVLATIFAMLSIFTDLTITGYSVKKISNLSLNFSIITIVLIIILVLILIIELYSNKIENKN